MGILPIAQIFLTVRIARLGGGADWLRYAIDDRWSNSEVSLSVQIVPLSATIFVGRVPLPGKIR
jgi:hypothetical protein